MSGNVSPDRDELAAKAPFLSWTILYGIVAVALAAEILGFAIVTLVYR